MGHQQSMIVISLKHEEKNGLPPQEFSKVETFVPFWAEIAIKTARFPARFARNWCWINFEPISLLKSVRMGQFMVKNLKIVGAPDPQLLISSGGLALRTPIMYLLPPSPKWKLRYTPEGCKFKSFRPHPNSAMPPLNFPPSSSKNTSYGDA